MGRWLRSIRLLIVSSALAVSVLVAVAMYWATTDVFERTVRQSAVDMSASLADGTFNAMYQIMRQGWTRAQLNEFLQTIRTQGNDSSARIELYRGSKVIAQFGPIEQPDPDPLVLSAFKQGKIQTRMHEGQIRYDRPLIAEAQCLKCHTDAQVGNVLGVLSITQSVTQLTTKAHEEFVNKLWLIMPIPLLAAVMVALLLGGRMSRSITLLKNTISRLERVEDLAHIRFSDAHTGFSELDDVLIEVDNLTGKLRHLAVDRNLLEFEIRLLERFVITSDVVRDWRRYVRDLLKEINTVQTVHGVFTAFAVGDRPASVELFWFDAINESVAATMSQRVQLEIGETLGLVATDFVPRQHSIDPSNRPPLDNARLLDLRTKEIIMDNPSIHGVVGLILPSTQSQSQVERLLIESILSTMLNVVGSVRAIEKHTEDLEFYATRDPLTHLYNQRMFWSLLDYEMGRAQRHIYQFGLFVIDIDDFKVINDNFGHAFGDSFLRQVSECLQDGVRTGDILSRYGGDEFTAILPEAGEKECIMVADRLLARMRNLSMKTPDGHSVGVSLSIGIAIGPIHTDSARSLFSLADAQMYRAKLSGKNQFALPNPEAPLADLQEQPIEDSDVLEALTERPPRILFQPIFSIQDAVIEPLESLLLERVGMEVLPQLNIGNRWVMARDFIGLVERRGQADTFDRHLMAELIRPEVAEHCHGLIFINISPRTVRAKSFLPDIARLMDAAGMARNRLVFELNERESLADLNLFDRFIESLHGFDFKFAIDQATPGHWIFQHLRRHTVDYVKIDVDWITNRGQIIRDRAFIDSLLGLARALSVTVIAQEVETTEQLAAVRAAGISWAQGSLFAQEIPLAELNNAGDAPAAKVDIVL
jgi:diguanylate cyclase (GGDEF)-like protein